MTAAETPAPMRQVPVDPDVLDEAYRILAAWAEMSTVPGAWRERMASAAQRLYNHGARAASERAGQVFRDRL